MLAALEAAISEFEDTNQDFIVHTLQKLLTRLNGLFNRFVDQQIRGIEETKVKINKRKGVISFMRTFPVFSTAVENMLTAHSSSSLSDSRDLVARFLAYRARVGGTRHGVTRPFWQDKDRRWGLEEVPLSRTSRCRSKQFIATSRKAVA